MKTVIVEFRMNISEIAYRIAVMKGRSKISNGSPVTRRACAIDSIIDFAGAVPHLSLDGDNSSIKVKII